MQTGQDTGVEEPWIIHELFRSGYLVIGLLRYLLIYLIFIRRDLDLRGVPPGVLPDVSDRQDSWRPWEYPFGLWSRFGVA